MISLYPVNLRSSPLRHWPSFRCRKKVRSSHDWASTPLYPLSPWKQVWRFAQLPGLQGYKNPPLVGDLLVVVHHKSPTGEGFCSADHARHAHKMLFSRKPEETQCFMTCSVLWAWPHHATLNRCPSYYRTIDHLITDAPWTKPWEHKRLVEL